VAGFSSTTQSQQILERSRLRVPGHALSLRTAIIVFVGLLILFRWLHLILALQLASTGRQIQIATEELQKAGRYNATLVRQISAAEAPVSLGSRATQLGYRPSTLLYLKTDVPIAHPTYQDATQWASDRAEIEAAGGSNSPAPWAAIGLEPIGGHQAGTAP
jgi:hypothetical protein